MVGYELVADSRREFQIATYERSLRADEATWASSEDIIGVVLQWSVKTRK